MKKNLADEYESIMVSLSPSTTPIAYKNRVNELIESGLDEKEAENVAKTPIELELYYQKGFGLFGIDSEAVECDSAFSPYTREPIEDVVFDFIRRGTIVWWNDPEGVSSGHYTVIKTPDCIEDDSVILIANEWSEAEVLASELSINKYK